MIKYETIISNFDDKTTLYNWLRKVEEALKNASATNFVVNKKGNATLSFSITFADGTTLESGDIVLQQGESVDDARIASGILQLHLTNGTWLTAGNVKPVNNFNIDESQHLIVNYQDGTSQDLGAIFQGDVVISGNITATGTIDGNLVTGNIIVEKMSGYSFTKSVSSANFEWEYVYAGAVKNGNKITFCTAVKVTRKADVVGNVFGTMGLFTIPTGIGDLLYPVNIGGNNVLSARNIDGFIDSTQSKSFKVQTIKGNNYTIYTNIVLNNDMTINTPYYLRLEETYLLSENLAQ